MSQTAPPATADDAASTRDRILDATLSWAVDTGMRKVSVDEIARRAGVSRATVYVHFPGRSSLVEAAIEREIGRLLEQISTIAENYADSEQQLVETVAQGMLLLRKHPALRSVLRVNPQVLLPYVVGEHAIGIDVGRAFVVALMDNTPIADRERNELAEHIIRQFHSHLLAPTETFDLDTPEGCRSYARRFLLPVLGQLATGDASTT
jgi:AcrR family transcriptional regulator